MGKRGVTKARRKKRRDAKRSGSSFGVGRCWQGFLGSSKYFLAGAESSFNARMEKGESFCGYLRDCGEITGRKGFGIIEGERRERYFGFCARTDEFCIHTPGGYCGIDKGEMGRRPPTIDELRLYKKLRGVEEIVAERNSMESCKPEIEEKIYFNPIQVSDRGISRGPFLWEGEWKGGNLIVEVRPGDKDRLGQYKVIAWQRDSFLGEQVGVPLRFQKNCRRFVRSVMKNSGVVSGGERAEVLFPQTTRVRKKSQPKIWVNPKISRKAKKFLKKNNLWAS